MTASASISKSGGRWWLSRSITSARRHFCSDRPGLSLRNSSARSFSHACVHRRNLWRVEAGHPLAGAEAEAARFEGTSDGVLDVSRCLLRLAARAVAATTSAVLLVLLLVLLRVLTLRRVLQRGQIARLTESPSMTRSKSWNPTGKHFRSGTFLLASGLRSHEATAHASSCAEPSRAPHVHRHVQPTLALDCPKFPAFSLFAFGRDRFILCAEIPVYCGFYQKSGKCVDARAAAYPI